VLRRAFGDSFVAEAQVGIVMQPQGAITELGDIWRKDHTPGVFSCPPHADSVDHRTSGVAEEWLFAAGASKMNVTEI
jgi:hypothetical protein